MHGIIPLKNILFRRHIGTSGTCPVCNLDNEDIMHMAFKCPEAMIIWRGLGLETFINNAIRDGQSGSVVLQDILKSTPASVHGYEKIKIHDTVAIAVWYIWWLSRRRTHGEPVLPARRCVASIMAIAANAAAYHQTGFHNSKISWEKPRAGYLKLNVDAAFDITERTGATGAVLRDN